MTGVPRTRVLLGGLALVALAAAVVWAASELTPFGTPSGPANAITRTLVHHRQAANTVNGITYDLRGLDTLGEELILFVAALGSAVLLRHGRGEDVERQRAGAEPAPATPDALRVAGAVLVGPLIVLGAYVVTHGHLTPGGGFQGGVILAAGLLLAYAAGQVVALQRIEPTTLVEVADATGALAYGLVALGGLVFAAAALSNFLPYGTTGHLLSAGTIPVLSVAVGVEVTGAVALILTELLDQTLLVRGE
ncbi:MAG TPA: MnhB domain-containing protein [Conexibacter sp.]|nr:MnhB domain-containing protein [Conexibacter sp.]